MLNRRSFTAFACCALHWSLMPSARAQGTSQWICGTVDKVIGPDTPMALDKFAGETGFDRQVIDTAVRDFQLTPFGTARLQDRWRRGDGLTPGTGMITLGVHFLNGGEKQKETVRLAARRWLEGPLGQSVQFSFDVPRQQAQITVNLLSDRNNSIVGRASATYAQSQSTMNLHDIVDHVVMHEFGHSLGLNHEHQNPASAIKWRRSAVIAEMEKQGWTEKMCEDNIFTRYSSNFACVGSPAFDQASIMLYPIPAAWTEDGYSTGTNTVISPNDRKCVVGIYKL